MERVWYPLEVSTPHLPDVWFRRAESHVGDAALSPLIAEVALKLCFNPAIRTQLLPAK